MTLQEDIKEFLSGNDELRKDGYSGHPLAGHCYVASEALYHLSDRNLKPMFIKHEGENHWYLMDEDTGEYIDLTAEQFVETPNHREGVGKGFLTKDPSRRAQAVIEAIS